MTHSVDSDQFLQPPHKCLLGSQTRVAKVVGMEIMHGVSNTDSHWLQKLLNTQYVSSETNTESTIWQHSQG